MSQIKRASAVLPLVQGRDRERREVGSQDHVGFLAAHEPVDRTAVEGDPPLERAIELADRDRDVLADAEDVDERQTHEAHFTLPRDAHDVAFGRCSLFANGR